MRTLENQREQQTSCVRPICDDQLLTSVLRVNTCEKALMVRTYCLGVILMTMAVKLWPGCIRN